MNKRESEMRSAIESTGLEVISIERGRHMKATVSRNGIQRKVFFSSSSSDVRAIKNFKSACKKVYQALGEIK